MKRNNEIRKHFTLEHCHLYNQLGYSSRELGIMFGVSHSFIQKLFKEQGVTLTSKARNSDKKEFKGWRVNDSGYITMSLGNNNTDLEHRIVAQNYLKRAIYPNIESVHHIDGNRSNNSVSNLCVIDKPLHDAFHIHLRNCGKSYKGKGVNLILETLQNMGYSVKVEMYAELIRITKG